MTLRETLRRSDPVLAGSAFLLSLLSLLLLSTGTEGRFTSEFFLRQLVSLGIAVLVFLLVMRTHYVLLRTLAPAAYLALLGFLLIVLQSEAIRGAASWLAVGALRLQPSELAKVVLVLVLAKVLSERRRERLDTRILLLTMVYVGIPVALVLAQPDVGTAALLLFLWLGMVVIAGMNRRQAVVLLVLAVVAGGVFWGLFFHDYQKDRLRVFLRPGSDPLGAGYTVIQSVTAFGSGGLWGRGLGYGPQSRLKFLPEHHTDFIFARIGEELGLVGVIGVLTLYGVILFRMLRAAQRTSDHFGRALGVGAFLTLLVGVLVNAGMNIGLLPVTGVPLPLVSYGGSSLVTTFLLIGLVESVLIHGETWETGDEEEPGLDVTAERLWARKEGARPSLFAG